jgi:pimeloyl-ACP methyl ester carboxylesterase
VYKCVDRKRTMHSANGLSSVMSVFAFAAVCAQGVLVDSGIAAQPLQATSVTREDIFVPHVSTVPATAGQRVRIAVRHIARTGATPNRGAVLFANPGSISAVAMLDVDYKTYSLPAMLAQRGFDVYVMDPTGVGRSPHPTMDDPCNADPTQQHLLIPNPLRQPCRANYPHALVSVFTDADEVASVAEYIRNHTSRTKVSLAGWSRAMFRLGLYAVRYPEKVERLAIVGPGYRPNAPTDVPSSEVPYSFRVRALGDQLESGGSWARQRKCPDIVEPGLEDALLTSFRSNMDPGAAQWGTPPGSVYRVPMGSDVDAGWNRQTATRLTVPILIVVGEHDPRATADAPALYRDVGSREKTLVNLECATHFALWERNHHVVHQVVAEFLTQGMVNGRRGVITVDRAGKFAPDDKVVR